ncbi:hypothetical protein [Paenibacillus sp. USHLN196]|uniref:hypothetical protein n=1 Tax=Paenibacillus sp. USHLN196 TaxID=3081291 RepID=UPI00301AB882
MNIEKYINTRFKHLGVHGFRNELIEQKHYLVFNTTIKYFEVLALYFHDKMSNKEIKKFINDFSKELHGVINQGFDDCHEYGSNCGCIDSESNVAWDLGFSIDDDGHWIPHDDNFVGRFEFLYPDEYELVDANGNKFDVEEYHYFMVLKYIVKGV